MRYCSNCGREINDNSRFCMHCGASVPPTGQPGPGGTPSHAGKGVMDHINDYLGNSGDRTLNWKMLFTSVFKPHTKAEAEEIFICGTKSTTPPLRGISTSWPHPWLYSRVFLLFAITYTLLWILLFSFKNPLSVPGLIIIGSFAMPLTVLVLFLEVNVFKNISILDVSVYFLVCGCASLIVTMLIFNILDDAGSTDNFGGALVIGIVEEIGKALIVYFIMSRIKCRYLLCAMLVGAAVGAGFAAFESAGYAMVYAYSFDSATSIIYLRAFLAPGGHVIWAAMSGAGIIFALKAIGRYDISMLYNSRFLRIFAIPVVLHALWDAPLGFGILWQVALSLVGWVVILLLVNMGLAEASNASRSC